MHYEASGRGPDAVVFVHGYTGCWLWWQETMPRLPDRYRSFALDLRGAGDSDKPEDGYTLEQYAEDVLAFSRAVGLERFAYVGHSMGGAIGYQFTLAYPERLRALVLVNPVPADGMTPPPGMSSQEAEQLRERFLATFKEERETALSFYRDRCVHRPVAAPLIEAICDKGLGVSEGHLRDSLDSMAGLRLGERLGDMTVPSLMVVGDRDELVPPDRSIEGWRRIPGCSLQVFQRVGHSPQLEVPDEFANVLVDFLEHLEG